MLLDGGDRSLSELGRAIEVPIATVQREVERLERAGIVRSRRIGNVRSVSANEESPYHAALCDLLLKAVGPVTVLDEALADLEGISASYLFGSWARRYLGEPGEAPADIDLIVIGDPEPQRVHDAVRDAETRLGRPVNVAILSEREWDEPGSGFLRAVHHGPLVAVGRPPA